MAYTGATQVPVFFTSLMPKSIGSFVIDAFVVEDHHSSVSVTEFPLEDGSTVSDNVIDDPDELIISGIVGATAISPVPIFPQVIGIAQQIQSLAGGALPASRMLDADFNLSELKRKKQPLTIVTGLRVYTDMILQDYRVRRDKSTGAALVFDMTFREIKTVASQLTSIPNDILNPANSQTQSGADMGMQTGAPPENQGSISQFVQGQRALDAAVGWNGQ